MRPLDASLPGEQAFHDCMFQNKKNRGRHLPFVISIFCSRCKGQMVTQMAGVALKTFQGETIVPAGRLQSLQCQLVL